ncbi:MAG: methylenetetrahydrofolate reductase [Gammaproteobacteria bacterium]|nr:methylenetetrahydrofolate reductase [Gammaproteobacteria bacterium]
MSATADLAAGTRGDSELARCLRAGRFAVTAEISPPVSADPREVVANALPLRGIATAVNVTDGAGAKAHLPALVTAHLLLRNGIEPVLQMTCRDRNRIALQSDLLGAAALGIRNVLVLRGDDPGAGDQPDAKPVFDLDSRALLAIADRLRNRHQLPTGTAVGGAPQFLLGAADTPVDPPPDWDPQGLVAKVAAGADFVQTQFCMDLEIVRRYAARLVALGIAPKLRVLIGVCPLPSARSARWMREKLFGTIVADSVVARLEAAGDPREEGQRICAEFLDELSRIPGVAGAHVMAPANPEVIPAVIAASAVTGARRAAVRQ